MITEMQGSGTALWDIENSGNRNRKWKINIIFPTNKYTKN